jgi:hypothetical protein
MTIVDFRDPGGAGLFGRGEDSSQTRILIHQ